MRKLTAIILIAAVAFSAPSPVGPRLAEADPRNEATAGFMVALVVEVIILEVLQGSVNTLRNYVAGNLKTLLTRAITEQQLDDAMYAHDHRALAPNRQINPTSGALSGLYSDLTNAGGVSFGGGFGDADLERFLTGRAAVSPADFHGDYRRRTEALGKYAQGVMNGNDGGVDRLIQYHNNAVAAVNALSAGDAKGDLKDIWHQEYVKMRDFNDWFLPYSATSPTPSHLTVFDDDILTGPGYRRTIQASGQISNLKNHLMASARASLTRQLEADVKYAHNRQQESADSHFAFERAVGSWHPVNGTGY
ncbi:MAG: hypothetical protein FWG71_08075 [Synergistaceae bacterium]|nr:hypothetical protein [Synergistaceae bacterium]